MNRAYSLLNVKAVDEDQRIIRGMATTPDPDRVGDIVEPLGVKFKNPLPLLHQHDSDKPVGTVKFEKPTAEGIPFEAKLPTISEPGPLKDRVDTAWGEVKAGLVRAVSIGFRALEYAFIEGGNGIRFIETEVLELSLVTIPANAQATITEVKSIDRPLLAATGKEPTVADRPAPPGASGKSLKPVNLRPKEGTNMKTIAEQIAALEAARAAKAARMAEVMQKSIDDGRSTDEAEKEEFDTLEQEVGQIDGDLKRLRALEKAQAAAAKPVTGVRTVEDGGHARDPRLPATVRMTPKAEPGIRYARLARCKGLAAKTNSDVLRVAETLYGQRDPIVVDTIKAAVAAGSTLSGNWAEDLVGDTTSAFADFVEFLRPQTILGKFGANGVPSLRRVPFRVPLVGQTSGGDGYWVGQGQAKPLTAFDFSRTTLEPLKVANIAVATMELLRDSSPSAETILRDQLAAALRERLDIDFIDPTKSASAGVSPASITNGVSAISSTGNTADDIREDIRLLFAAFIAANNAPTSGVWIMASATALALSQMRNPLGQKEFPGITIMGGELEGLPVITSEYFSPVSAGGFVALVNAQDIYLADDGQVSVDMSTEASLEMSNTPAHNSGTPTPAQLVSMFQTNSVAFRAERTINWAKRRASAVAVLDEVNWGQPGS